MGLKHISCAVLTAALFTPGLALAQTTFPSTNPNAQEWALIGLTPTIVASAKGGAGVIVGVYDGLTACNVTDLAGRCANFKASNGSYLGFSTHGTHTAGTIAGAKYGVATGASVQNYAVFDSYRYIATGSGLITAWNTAASFKSSIASMSFGCPRIALCLSAAEIQAMGGPTLSGMLFVKAAGNDGVALGNESILVTQVQARAALDRLLMVGSVNATGVISSFSNRPGEGCLLHGGATVCTETQKWKYRFMVAPGEAIVSNMPGNSYAYMSGTSMATPVVAGAAALLEGRWPVLKTQPARVATILLNSATDLGATGVDPVYGRGLLNVGRAFQSSGLAAIVAPSGQRTVVSNGAVSVSPVMRRAWKVMSGVTAFDEHGRDYQLGQIHNLKVRSTHQDSGSSAASAIDMGGQASWAPDFFAGPSAPAAYVGFGSRSALVSQGQTADRTLRASLDAPVGASVVSVRLTGGTDVRADFASDPGLRPLGFFASSNLLGRSALTGMSLPLNGGDRLVLFGASSLSGSPGLGAEDSHRLDLRADSLGRDPTFLIDRSPLRQSSVGIGYWARPDSRTVVGVSVTSMVQRHGFYDLASDFSSFDAPVALHSLGLAASRSLGAWELYGAAEATAIKAPESGEMIAFSDSLLVSGEIGARLNRDHPDAGLEESLAIALRATPQAVSGQMDLNYMTATEDGLDTRATRRQTSLAEITGQPVRIEGSYSLGNGRTWSTRIRGGADLTGGGDYRLAAEARLTF
ncbi:MAG: S8 family serine peptidase [Caulobacter sp.]|nr:S8 family serine peptidase [Caulobacter sp.]